MGLGWDSHTFVPGRPLWLGGVRVKHPAGLAGHSDGDVLLHALCDALLGAAALGDIGVYFPSGGRRWKDARSAQFVRHALGLVRAAGWRPSNVDAVLILNEPRLGPIRERLRRRLATLLGIPVAAISIKAKTAEGLGTPDTAIAQVVVLLAADERGQRRTLKRQT